MQKLSLLENALHYNFKNKDLLKIAVTHSSYSSNIGDNYERLEFLGDAILNFVISEYLYKKYKNQNEGTLSRIKSYIASEEFLYIIAKKINLGSHILLGKGELKTGGRNKKSILADTVEAIVAAIFLDGGIKKTKKVIKHLISKEIHDTFLNNENLKDHKSKLQEYFLAIEKKVPKYKLEKEYGPEHQKTFEISVWINNQKIGFGVGSSKKEAEQIAAQNALNNLNLNHINFTNKK
jgi:ribonuclease-3